MKKFILFSFLLTNVITSHAVELDLNLHVQNLSDVQIKKMQELSELSRQIAEKNALIESWSEQIINILNADEDEKDPSISDEVLIQFVKKLERAFCQKKDLNGVLTEGFSVATKDYRINFVKVFMVRVYFERLLVGKLIEHYEKCLQEFNVIDSK